MQHGEKGYAAAKSGVQIVSANGVVERSEAHGTYKIEAIGPVEHMRDRYVALRDRLCARGINGFIDRLINGARMFKELSAIPMELKWADVAENIVTTVGKNLALDTYLAGSAYTVTGPFMFLINTNASAAVAGDTMSSHPGWLEVGNANAPTYTSPRKTCAWSAASAGAKALSSALSFAITSSGTVGGCGIVFGSGAVSTIDSTAGTLYSAGAFTGGSKAVTNGDTLNVSYSTSL
jgi:hypothetical protein